MGYLFICFLFVWGAPAQQSPAACYSVRAGHKRFLYENQLTGQIPSSIGNLNNLESMYAAYQIDSPHCTTLPLPLQLSHQFAPSVSLSRVSRLSRLSLCSSAVRAVRAVRGY